MIMMSEVILNGIDSEVFINILSKNHAPGLFHMAMIKYQRIFNFSEKLF